MILEFILLAAFPFLIKAISGGYMNSNHSLYRKSACCPYILCSDLSSRSHVGFKYLHNSGWTVIGRLCLITSDFLLQGIPLKCSCFAWRTCGDPEHLKPVSILVHNNIAKWTEQSQPRLQHYSCQREHIEGTTSPHFWQRGKNGSFCNMGRLCSHFTI